MIATLYYRHRPLAKLRIILRHDKNLLNQRVCADNPLDFLRLNAFSAAKKRLSILPRMVSLPLSSRPRSRVANQPSALVSGIVWPPRQ